MKIGDCWFSSIYCLLFPFLKRKSMFAVLHLDINSLRPGLLHLTGQPYYKKCRSVKVKDGARNYSLRNYLVERFSNLLPVVSYTIKSYIKMTFHPHILLIFSLYSIKQWPIFFKSHFQIFKPLDFFVSTQLNV